MKEKIVNIKNRPLNEYFTQRICLNKIENLSLDGRQEMTREVYDSCVEKLIRLNEHGMVMQVMREYPVYTEACVKEAEEESKYMNLPEETPEETEKSWQKMLSMIQEYEQNRMKK